MRMLSWADNLYTITESFRGSAVMINDETYGKLDSKKMRKLIKEYQRKEKQDAVKQAEPAEA